MGRTKQTVIEKSRKQYLKKMEKLKELIKDKEISKQLDFDNSKLYLADEYGISGCIGIPLKEKTEEGTAFVLEQLIYHTSVENKLKLYSYEVLEDEILLKNTTIQRNITKDITSSLLKRYFCGTPIVISESIPLFDESCIPF